MDEEVAAAGVQLDVSPPDMLPAEAPQLHLRVIARAGGVTITSAPGSLAANCAALAVEATGMVLASLKVALSQFRH